ncbi:ATP-binding cassette sub-family G member 4-like isoform X3 [Haemaphysalis longicornis]
MEEPHLLRQEREARFQDTPAEREWRSWLRKVYGHHGTIRGGKDDSPELVDGILEDRLLPALTVHEAIAMSVELRMPCVQAQDKTKKVEESIQEWGLTDCRKTRTEALSGGERRRLAIAQELVNNPPVLFLDEPTSGLDTSTSRMCVGVLKRLAARGHTVICSVHVPSATIFSYFDTLYMLSQGRCIYNGQVEGLLHFLSQRDLHCPKFQNPADYISEIASGEHGECWSALSEEFTVPVPEHIESSKNLEVTIYGGKIMTSQEKVNANKNYNFKVNQWHQFLILLKRCWLSNIRNMIATPLRLLAYVVFSLTMVLLFYDIGTDASTVTNNVTLFFSMCCVCVFQSILPAVIVFPVQLAVLMREQRNCWYSLNIYYLANYVAEIPFLVVPILLYMGITYYPTGQPLELWRVAAVVLFAVQLCSVSQSIGLVVSAVTTVQTAVFTAIPAVSPFFYFCGYFVPAHLLSPYVAWITDTSYIFYGYSGLLLTVYGYDRAPLRCAEFICLYQDPAEFLEFTGTAGWKIHELSLALLGFELFFRVLAYGLLKYRLTKKE